MAIPDPNRCDRFGEHVRRLRRQASLPNLNCEFSTAQNAMLPPNWYNRSVMRIGLLLLVAVSILSACAMLEPSSTEAPTQALLPFHTRTPSSPPRQDLSTPVRLTTPQPSPTPLIHLIQGGDTLLGISIRYGVSLEDLLIANTGIDPGFLSIDQEIIIPGPEGEPVGVLLPSPTPMLVEIGRPQCFRAAPDDLLCITEIRNDTGEMIEGMTVSFEIIEAGIEVGKYAIFGPLNLLAPGTSMPFMIRIAGWDGEVPGVSVNVLSGVRVEDPGSRYATVSIDGLQDDISEGGEYVKLSGEVLLEDASDYAAHRLRVLGVAYSSTGYPVGYTVWEDEITGDFSQIPFDITVFSLGGRIFKTDIFTEAQGFDPE
jgi:LysM repeat protein